MHLTVPNGLWHCNVVTVIVTYVSFLGMETPQGADTLPCGREAAKKPLCELLLLAKKYFEFFDTRL